MTFNPYVPRPIDLPTEVPLEGDLSSLDEAKIFAAPDDAAQWPVWRDQLTRWRTDARQRLGYTGARYRRVPDCFTVCLAWLWDETLYDHRRGVFTVDAFLDVGEAEFGGFDGLVLWHAYPVIGLDERNQFDYYRDVPELPELVRACQARGVSVFVDYNPWDTGTRRERRPDAEVIAELVGWLGADGVFLDTLKEGAGQLRAALDAVRPDAVLAGESRVPLARIEDHAMSWAQSFADSPVPGVLRAKWFERRHLLHHTRRWHRSHLDELHSAWLNGCGMLVWESVFGVWVGWSVRDKALLRGMRRVQRDYAAWLCAAPSPATGRAGRDGRGSGWPAGTGGAASGPGDRSLWRGAVRRRVEAAAAPPAPPRDHPPDRRARPVRDRRVRGDPRPVRRVPARVRLPAGAAGTVPGRAGAGGRASAPTWAGWGRRGWPGPAAGSWWRRGPPASRRRRCRSTRTWPIWTVWPPPAGPGGRWASWAGPPSTRGSCR